MVLTCVLLDCRGFAGVEHGRFRFGLLAAFAEIGAARGDGLEVFADAFEDLVHGVRVVDDLAEPRAAVEPFGELARELLHAPDGRELGHVGAQQFEVFE